MHSIKPFKNEIVLKKIIKKFTSILFWNPISFYGNCYEKQEESGTNYQSVFRLSNKFSFSRDPSPDHFGCFNSKRFNYVIPKIAINNLCKQFHDVMTSPFLAYSWNFEMLDKNEENLKNLNTSRAKRASHLKLKAFFIILEGFYVGKI